MLPITLRAPKEETEEQSEPLDWLYLGHPSPAYGRPFAQRCAFTSHCDRVTVPSKPLNSSDSCSVYQLEKDYIIEGDFIDESKGAFVPPVVEDADVEEDAEKPGEDIAEEMAAVDVEGKRGRGSKKRPRSMETQPRQAGDDDDVLDDDDVEFYVVGDKGRGGDDDDDGLYDEIPDMNGEEVVLESPGNNAKRPRLVISEDSDDDSDSPPRDVFPRRSAERDDFDYERVYGSYEGSRRKGPGRNHRFPAEDGPNGNVRLQNSRGSLFDEDRGRRRGGEWSGSSDTYSDRDDDDSDLEDDDDDYRRYDADGHSRYARGNPRYDEDPRREEEEEERRLVYDYEDGDDEDDDDYGDSAYPYYRPSDPRPYEYEHPFDAQLLQGYGRHYDDDDEDDYRRYDVDYGDDPRYVDPRYAEFQRYEPYPRDRGRRAQWRPPAEEVEITITDDEDDVRVDGGDKNNNNNKDEDKNASNMTVVLSDDAVARSPAAAAAVGMKRKKPPSRREKKTREKRRRKVSSSSVEQFMEEILTAHFGEAVAENVLGEDTSDADDKDDLPFPLSDEDVEEEVLVLLSDLANSLDPLVMTPFYSGLYDVCYDTLMTSGPQDQVMVSEKQHDMNITRGSLMTLVGEVAGKKLTPRSHLNDEIINGYMSLLKKRSADDPIRFPKIFTFNTFFFESLRQGGHSRVRRWTKNIDLFAFDMIVVPLNFRSERHWGLFIADLARKTLIVYDSMNVGPAARPSKNARLARIFADYLVKEHAHKKSPVPFDIAAFTPEYCVDGPEQRNLVDCGVFSMRFAEVYTRRGPIHFCQSEMLHYRKRAFLGIFNRTIYDGDI